MKLFYFKTKKYANCLGVNDVLFFRSGKRADKMPQRVNFKKGLEINSRPFLVVGVEGFEPLCELQKYCVSWPYGLFLMFF
jgi:hypothetical protein